MAKRAKQPRQPTQSKQAKSSAVAGRPAKAMGIRTAARGDGQGAAAKRPALKATVPASAGSAERPPKSALAREARQAGKPSAGGKGSRRPFLTDVTRLRERARQHIEQGAVTLGYRADRATVIRLLNEALATEIVCVLRYKRHYFMASGINAQSVAQEFLQHANEEQTHADEIAQRIVQLGGEPDLSPDGLLTRSHSEYVEGANLIDMIKEDLVAERVAIDSYREMIGYLGTNDPTTRRMLEGILAMEEEHADDLVSLLAELGQ